MGTTPPQGDTAAARPPFAERPSSRSHLARLHNPLQRLLLSPLPGLELADCSSHPASRTGWSPSPLGTRYARRAPPAFAAGPVRPPACGSAVVTIQALGLTAKTVSRQVVPACASIATASMWSVGTSTASRSGPVLWPCIGERRADKGQAAKATRHCAATGGRHARR
jgi:hypothetical protein